MCADAMTVTLFGRKYGKRKGMDGPFQYPNGRVLYFDRKEKEYWDPTTDFFVPDYEVDELKMSLFKVIAK